MNILPGKSKEEWKEWSSYEDILLHKTDDGIARIAINRPNLRNAFRPETVMELIDAFNKVKFDEGIGVVLFTGAGPDKKGIYSFCSGGDQSVRGTSGYKNEKGKQQLNVLELQKLIRSLPKVVIALVPGFAIGGGQVLHLICDLSIASENAIFGQTGPKVGSFDAGFGSSYLARIVGPRKAKEIWFLCRKYNAKEALEMGLINSITKIENLEKEGISWAREILKNSPTAIQILKASFNAENDGIAGIQELSGYATQLFYGTNEAQEGKNAFLEKRQPDFSDYKWTP
tara:strand:+ start:2268 stop:3125 length:858 start_codon:yes stop_codon:yes gene_type:complete